MLIYIKQIYKYKFIFMKTVKTSEHVIIISTGQLIWIWESFLQNPAASKWSWSAEGDGVISGGPLDFVFWWSLLMS